MGGATVPDGSGTGPAPGFRRTAVGTGLRFAWLPPVIAVGAMVAAGVSAERCAGTVVSAAMGASGGAFGVTFHALCAEFGSGLRWALLAMWAALVAADERAVGPLFLHQPLVAASMAGVLLGNPLAGLGMGFALQAVWPGLLPMGGSRQPAVGPAAVIGTAWLCLLSPLATPWDASVAVVLALLAATVGEWTENRLRRRNERRERVVYAEATCASGVRVEGLLASGGIEASLVGPLLLLSLVLMPAMILLWVSDLALGFESRIGAAETWWGLAGLGQVDLHGGLRGAPLGALLLFALGGVLGQRALGLGIEVKRLKHRWQRGRSGDGATAPGAASSVTGKAGALGKPPGGKAVSETEPPGGETFQEHSGSPGAPFPRLRQWRAFLLLQASFNFAYLQRAGFLGIVRAIPEERLRGAEAIRSQTEFDIAQTGTYNTQPVLAAALAGGIERVLTEAGRGSLPRAPARLLTVGGAVLAQWGDRVLWGGVRPVLSLMVLGLTVLPVLRPWLGLLIYVGASLLFHVVMRWGLYRWGWRKGWDCVRGGRGWVWDWLPTALALLIPLLALWVGLVLARHLGPFAVGTESGVMSFFRHGLVWFILGLPLGLLVGGRALLWGWACALVLALGLTPWQ